VLFLIASTGDAVVTVLNPLLLRVIVDKGIIPRDEDVVIAVAGAMAGVALLDALAGFVIRWLSAWIGQGVTYDLRTQVFTHVQRQPLAFFTRAQTGSLVSRLNDVIGAQQAITSVMSSLVSNVLSVVAILIMMSYLSWVITLISLVLIPVFLLQARLVGRRLQRLTREGMQLDATLASMMNERFNVAGAMLVKLWTRRPRTWTRSPRRRCSGRCAPRWPGGPRW
jgi:ATP-binding cassette, subfamily B, bacterial